MQDPELTIDRAMMEYKQLGYSDHWINQRLKSIEVRKELTGFMLAGRVAARHTAVVDSYCQRGYARRGSADKTIGGALTAHCSPEAPGPARERSLKPVVVNPARDC